MAGAVRSSPIGLAAVVLTALVGFGGLVPTDDDPPAGPQPPASDQSANVPPDSKAPVNPAPVNRPPAKECRVTCLPDHVG